MFLGRSKKSESKQKSTKEHPPALPELVDVLIDTIIGYLEKSTAYKRAVGNQAFALLCDSVKETTIDLILAVRSLSCSVKSRLI
jgi:DNA polymerase phi